MKLNAIICEFNPFTKGHEYIIKQAKKLSKSPLICLMSGNFVQRGEPAVLDKYTRAMHAIKSGADVVIELPTIYALSSAPDFAYGAIKILNSIGCIDTLIFGSECGDINLLQQEAEKEIQYDKLKEQLKSGKSFASSSINFSEVLSSPNNILAVEYIRAINRTNSKIKPYTIKRANNYNDTSTDSTPSATALRALLQSNKVDEFIINSPTFATELIDNYNFSIPVEKLIEFKIKSVNVMSMSNINGISEGLEFRIVERINKVGNICDRMKDINTKRYPESKIKRILLNCLFDITKEIVNEAKESPSEYLKVLAINKKQTRILGHLPQNLLLTCKKDYTKLNDFAKTVVGIDLKASKTYSCIKDNYSALSDFTIGMKKV